jgi:hypothetical protein
MSVFKRNGDNVFIPKEYDDDDDEDFSDLKDISHITCASDITNVSDVSGVTDDTDVSYIPPKKNHQNECYKMDVEIATQPFEMSKINHNTYNIMSEFNNEVDCTKAYSFKELSEVLRQIFSANPEMKKLNNTKKVNDTKKRKPSAYNNYIKIRMNALKIEDPGRSGNENMSMARSEWRNFTQDQKDTYK